MKPSVLTGHPSRMRSFFAVLVLGMSVTTGVGRSQVPVAVDTLGPQPGTRVPEFSAADQNGRAHTLKSLLGPKGAMLVFSRSADW